MSTSPSPGSGIGACVSSKLSRLGAPSGLLFSRTWRLTPATIEPLPRLRATRRGEASFARPTMRRLRCAQASIRRPSDHRRGRERCPWCVPGRRQRAQACRSIGFGGKSSKHKATEDSPMDIIPLGPGFAAELRGVTLAGVAADDAVYDETRAALEEHSVLVFRGQ